MMRKRFFKIGTVFLVCVCLVSFSVLSVSAEGTVPTGYMRMPINVGNNWLEDYGQISPSITNGDSSFEFKLPTAYYPPFETGRYFSVDFFSVQPSIINNYNDYYFGLKCFNTEVMSATLSFKGTDLSYEFTSDGYVDGYDYLHLELESFNFPSSEINIYIVFRKVYEGNYNIILDEFYFRSSSTGNIINNQNENTDKVVNGWNGGKPIDNSTANALKDSESAALGGKTDAEIQAEVDNALNFDLDVFDSIKVGKIHYLFDGLLNVAGGGYQALFMLSLTLGLAAFIIGRRYG